MHRAFHATIFVVLALLALCRVTSPAFAYSNQAPIAFNDEYTINEDTTLTVDPPGVTDNDYEPDGDPLTVTVTTAPQHGDLTLYTNGSFVFIPDTNYNGADSFEYLLDDGKGGTSAATATITITPISDGPPTAVSDTYETDEDVQLNVGAPGVLANDTDYDAAYSDPMTAVLVTGTENGTVVLNDDGSFTYTPADDFFGADSFTYCATDGANSNTVTVTITVNAVNDAPIAVGETYEIDEDTVLSFSDVDLLMNDRDVDNATLYLTVVQQPANGTLVWDDFFGNFVYSPYQNYCGMDSFTYTVSDGDENSEEATVTMNVTAVNDAPTTNTSATVRYESTDIPQLIPDNGTTDSTLLVNGFTGVVAKVAVDLYLNHTWDSDLDISVIAPDGTTVVLSADNGWGWKDFGTGALPAQRTRFAEDAPVAISDGVAPYVGNYRPDGDLTVLHGIAGDAVNGVWTLRMSDTMLLDSGTLQNWALILMPADQYAVDEDETLDIAVPGVLANDDDVEGDVLSALLVENPQHGSLTLNPDGSFTYDPEDDFHGADSFSYRASENNPQDLGANRIFNGGLSSPVTTVYLTINPVNDPPQASGDAYDATEDETLTVDAATGVLANDSDIDSGTLEAVIDRTTEHGTLVLAPDGSFTYDPIVDWYGDDSFTYHVWDGEDNSETVTVTLTVANVNDAPVAEDILYVDDKSIVEDTYLLQIQPGLRLGIYDLETPWGQLTVDLAALPSHAKSFTLYTNGAFYYEPDEDFNGVDSFQYYAVDGELYSEPATVTIHVANVNDLPVAVDDSGFALLNETITIDVLANDTDVDDDTLTVNAITVQPANGTAVVTGGGVSIQYTPNLDYTGSDSLTYEVSDGHGGTATAVVAIRVNYTPDAVNDEMSGDEDNSITSDVLENDSDGDAEDTITVTAVTQGTNGAVVLNPDGTITYTPTANWYGQDSFAYTMSDDHGATDTATVTVTVHSVNDAPALTDDSATTMEDNAVVVEVLTNDSDIELDALEIVSVTQGVSGAVEIDPAARSVTYTPNANFYGIDAFTYTVSDGTATQTANVTVSVTAVNDVPEILLTYPTDGLSFDEPADITITATASDVDGGVRMVEFYRDGIKLGSDSASPYNLTWDGVGRGTYTLQAKVTDVNGAAVWSNTATITVNNLPPAVAFTAPIDGATFVAGSSTTVRVNASDPSGIDRVVFYVNGMELARDHTNPYTVSWNGMMPGVHTRTAKAWDVDGLMAETTPGITVTVQDGHYQPDMGIRATGELAYIGEDVYGAATDQEKAIKTSTGLKAIYYVEVENDGNVPDSFTLTGSAGNGGWTVKYFDRANEANITEALTEAGKVTPILAPGATYRMRVEVTPDVTVPVNDVYSVDLTSISNSNGASDAVRATTARKTALSAVALAANPPVSTRANTNITLTATATGGGTVEYRFFKMGPGETAYTQIQAYSSDHTCDFSTIVPGTYSFIVWAREFGSTTKKAVAINYEFTSPYQPDMGIRVTYELGYVGENVYAPAEQKKERSTTAGMKAVYYLEVDNDGTADDSFIIAGTAGNAQCQVAYFDRATETDITDLVKIGGWSTPILAPGEVHRLRVEVSPTGSMPVNTNFDVAITAMSAEDETKVDTVIASTVNAETLTGVTLMAAPQSEQAVMQPIALTATAIKGGTVEYRFFAKGPNDAGFTQIQAYSTVNTASYTPLTAGSYSFLVWAREVGSTTKQSATVYNYNVTGVE